METLQLPITVNALRVDDKKLSKSFLEQLKVIDIISVINSHFEELEKYDLPERDFLERYEVICRISAAPIIENIRKSYSRLGYDKFHIDGFMFHHRDVDEYALVSVNGEICLHELKSGLPYSTRDDTPYLAYEEFIAHLKAAPKAIWGV